MPELYFAYGSNLDARQMARRCPGAEYLGVATLHNHVLRMDGAGFATVIYQRGSHVQGALWDLSHANEGKMDRFEGVEEGYYRKLFVGVTYNGDQRPGASLEDSLKHAYAYNSRDVAGMQLDAIIYLSSRPPYMGATWRKDYLDRIKRGAAALHLDTATRTQIASVQLIPKAEHKRMVEKALDEGDYTW